MMTESTKAQELLDRYLDGTATTAEQKQVEGWYDHIDLSEEHDTEAWAEASKELFLRKHARTVDRQPHLLAVKWAAAAAILIIIAGAGLFFSGTFAPQRHKALMAYHVETGAGGLKQITLPDSTVVWLNTNSRLDWSSDFGSAKRRVVLSGEASFDVHHDTEHPFVVHTRDADIQVLGTYFNVATETGSAAATQVALLRGKVALQLNEADSMQLVLRPGELASCSAGKKMLRKRRTDVRPYFSWTSGGFHAEDMALYAVIEKLCTRYGYTLSWDNRKGGHKHISVTFPRQEFKSMLGALCYVNHLKFTIDHHHVIIR